MNWILYALLAAVFWGMNYTLSEQMIRKFSLASLFLVSGVANIALAVGFLCIGGGLRQDYALLKHSGGDRALVVATVTVYAIANLFIVLSIRAKNATLAGMVEITYPLFTALFAYLFFKQVQISFGTLLGAGLVLCGVACIYFSGRQL